MTPMLRRRHGQSIVRRNACIQRRTKPARFLPEGEENQDFENGGRTKVRTWDPLIKS
jgi:hypothetical protein